LATGFGFGAGLGCATGFGLGFAGTGAFATGFGLTTGLGFGLTIGLGFGFGFCTATGGFFFSTNRIWTRSGGLGVTSSFPLFIMAFRNRGKNSRCRANEISKQIRKTTSIFRPRSPY
jgi:hypothetical protein